MKKEIPKAYNPKKVEDKIYKTWEKSGFFNPDNLPEENIKKDKNGKELTYTIVLPPPNITSKLHLGHAAMLAIEDLLVRYHRMKGYRTLWLPGTDHAAIATQNVVEKKLLKEGGLTRHDLGREKFLKKVWEYLEETQAVILNQTRKMGASLDWSREAFTLDKQREKAVRKMFVDMYEAGVIYRGERIINWCPRCQSTLADDEIEYKEQKTKLYTFRYSKDFPFMIATTRPETKLGDTAVAVNPKDKRYKKYIGKTYEVDFCGVKLKLKIIADRHVEMDFGTGALGVTPAHSMTDWQMAEENNLEIIKVIDENGKIRDGFGKYSDKLVLEAREMIIKNLIKNDLLKKEEEIENNLSLCYRCGTAIEPLPSKQWFINVDKKLDFLDNKSLKEKAIGAAKDKSIKFIPDRFEKRYLDWMENLHDWCISRQIWFGHRIPVWYRTKSQIQNYKSQINSKLQIQNSKIEEEIYVGIKLPKEKYNKAILLHAWDSNPDAAFFSWLKRELEFRGIKVITPSFPNPKNPDFSEWLKEFNKIETDEKTIVIGRSLGATLALGAAMRGKKFGNLVAVCTPLENPEIPEFFKHMGKLDFKKIKKNVKQYSVIHSSNDPYIKFEISKKLSEKLGVELIIVNNANHFSGKSYEEILKACDIWIQDPDSLDTWFSSGMWTFSTLGWPNNFKDGKKTGDLARFHPTQVLETGYEILTLWVSRMVIMSFFALREIPFENVYLHGMILDKHGKKMSKSKGNGIDPIDMIDKFGTDAVRLSLLIGSTPGNDTRIFEEKIEGQRNFVNKLWNISRYILMSVKKIPHPASPKRGGIPVAKTLADKWILGELNNLIKEVTNDLENYNFSAAGEKLREFTWNDFADWYLEISKVEKNKDELLIYILKDLLKLWHPFIPFVTEEIWKKFNNTNLIIENYPDSKKYNNKWVKFSEEGVAEKFKTIQNIIIAIRNARAKYKIEPVKKIDASIYAGKQKGLLELQASLIKEMRTGIDELEIKEKGKKIKDAVYVIVDDIEIYLTGIIDKEKERGNLEKEIDNLKKYLSQIKNKLKNKKFVANAPDEIVEKEKNKYNDNEEKLKKLKEKLKSLSK